MFNTYNVYGSRNLKQNTVSITIYFKIYSYIEHSVNLFADFQQ